MKHYMMPKAVLALLLAISTPVLHSAAVARSDERIEKIQRYLKHLETNNKFMGSVSISIGGKSFFQMQVGHFAKSNQTKLKPDVDTQYRIGSISKTFTAVMILQLIEEKKLSLETKLAKFFPNLKHANVITIEHLLRHRSGIGSITTSPAYLTWHTKAHTRTEMIEKIAKQPTRFKPNERAEYSNSNYLLLGYIIEKLSGNSYAVQLKTRIVNRLGLKRTAWAAKADAKKNVAVSYTYAFCKNRWIPVSQTDPSVAHGAGAIMSTTSDLVTFVESLFSGKLVNKASLDKMTMMIDRMGLGLLQQRPFWTKRPIGHSGAIDGFRALFLYFPEDRIAIAITGNDGNSKRSIANGLLSIAFKRKFQIPSFESKHVELAKLKRYEGVFSSTGLPIKIAVKVCRGRLTVRATNQPTSLQLTPISDVEFKAAGIVISFAESKPGAGYDLLRISQAGRNIKFSKED